MEAKEQNNHEKDPLSGTTWDGFICSGESWCGYCPPPRPRSSSPGVKKGHQHVRYAGWVPLVNAPASASPRNRQTDSALALFGTNTIYRDKPLAFLNAGHFRQRRQGRQRHFLLPKGV